jgi:hypothetical protein
MTYAPHPRDEWIDVTSFGQPEPQYILCQSGVEIEIAEAKAQYVAGHITIEQFETAVDRLMRLTMSEPE